MVDNQRAAILVEDSSRVIRIAVEENEPIVGDMAEILLVKVRQSLILEPVIKAAKDLVRAVRPSEVRLSQAIERIAAMIPELEAEEVVRKRDKSIDMEWFRTVNWLPAQ